MLTDDMKLWHGLVIAMVSLVLQACLLAAIYYLLSRHMAKENEQLLRRSRLWAPKPSPARHRSPAAQETKEMKETKEPEAERSTPAWEPRYRNNCNTSSESSDTSDSTGRSPPPCQAAKKVNYTQVVFPATGGLDNESALDYEDIEDMTDYVNINPKSHKHNLWTFVNPAASEPVEYSQVAM
ncbi:regulator of hemoglobinization and erythroid cell expansion protein isoform X1 [Pipistrellus kuhlii]|uniref:Regulator of hemoglobinization and erythroid cell expansion n=1 Tax=Pipistrellus kuhlii TaxID=59472 RepID=A0A7J7UU87_PIPKU|nr:regulator of hemoglobinization and erythroid cell expansion protein isoform X1 [Pipistrellus kuhlii]KAF6316500.1 regulator of hemoglobinization and erythroid cell expansion [Pipistrellus kuhlii]